MNNPNLGIIILNWNGEEDTISCIKSVLKCTYTNFRLYLCDNGSTDGSVETIQSTFSYESRVVVIANNKNLGFSGGNNVGMRKAIEDEMEYILLLNNDTEVDPGFIEPLIDVLKNNNDVGISTSKIYFHNTDKIIWFFGGRIDRDTAQGSHTGFDKQDNEQYSKSHDCDYATGCTLMTRSDIIGKAGYLDDDFFYFCEDAEYSFRIADLGYRIVAVPESIVWHKVGRSLTGGEESPIRLYFLARNRLLLVSKTKNRPHPLYGWVQLFGIYSKLIIRRVIRRKPLRGTLYFIWGIFDFLRNRRGNIPLKNNK